MNDIKKLLGQRIKELRRKKGISQQELAERADIDQRSLSHIECGDTFPSRSLFDLAQALDIELKELFDFEHLEVTTNIMKDYIRKSLDDLADEKINILYRFLKSLR